MDYSKLSKESLEEIVKQAGEAIRAKEVDKLKLVIDSDGSLNIEYKGNTVGYITTGGYCNILSASHWIGIYEQWRAGGMHVDSTPVEWRGKEYYISQNYKLKGKGEGLGIYDFDFCNTLPFYKDDNIIRHKHNNKPVLF